MANVDRDLLFGSPPSHATDTDLDLGPALPYHRRLGGRTPDESMARLMALADRMGIERLVIYMGTSRTSSTPRRRSCGGRTTRCSRRSATGTTAPSGSSTSAPSTSRPASARSIAASATGRWSGLKLWVAARCDCPEADALVRRAAELKAVVFQHTWIKAGGNEPGESTPMDLAALAARHPEASLICGHTGGQWELGIRAVRGLPNVVDRPGRVRSRRRASSRWPCASWARGGSSTAATCPAAASPRSSPRCSGADISDADRRLILGENLRRLLMPILDAKGVKP